MPGSLEHSPDLSVLPWHSLAYPTSHHLPLVQFIGVHCNLLNCQHPVIARAYIYLLLPTPESSKFYSKYCQESQSGISVISNILDMWLWPRNKGRYTSLENKEYGTALPESNQQIYLSLPGNEEGISNEHSERTTITAPIISTKTTCTEDQLPSLILAFPLPNPAREYNRADIPALFLYTLPRSVYGKPAKDPETGKIPRERIVRKMARMWQEMIQKGEDIKRGDFANPGWYDRAMGLTFRAISTFLRFMIDNEAQLCDRLPPLTKMGPIQVYYSTNLPNSVERNLSPERMPSVPSDEQLRETIINNLSQAYKRAKLRVIVSGLILPLAFAIEMYVPFTFEATLVYFIIQLRAWKIARFLVSHNIQKINQATDEEYELGTGNENGTLNEDRSGGRLNIKIYEHETLYEIIHHINRSCSNLDALKFPSATGINPMVFPETMTDNLASAEHTYQPKLVDDIEVAAGLIKLFQDHLPSDVLVRHELNTYRVAEDFNRALKTCLKAYSRQIIRNTLR
ncbi:hypothetical protein MJO28_002748 [Puccinia striiformis f. sp. tritici]|uniref:Uncharacterized protein n=1 Tax=Puccinia striiformis f. sp. tritici TaxID=168172 RepID=A0ACC0ESZ5_9BASI|nr:hypothetical protein MJO28_002748 [Puccinia striiformis f. sp. tritici]